MYRQYSAKIPCPWHCYEKNTSWQYYLAKMLIYLSKHSHYEALNTLTTKVVQSNGISLPTTLWLGLTPPPRPPSLTKNAFRSKDKPNNNFKNWEISKDMTGTYILCTKEIKTMSFLELFNYSFILARCIHGHTLHVSGQDLEHLSIWLDYELSIPWQQWIETINVIGLIH